MQYPIENENEVVETEPVKVTLVNTNDEPVAPMTTADQVIYDGGTIIDAFNDAIDAFNDAYDEATNAYNLANRAYDEANDAHSTANEAYEEACAAYELANTNSGHLRNVKVIFKALAGTMYNDEGEGMGYIYGENPTVPEINTEVNQAYGQANEAYSIADAAYHVAGSIYNRVDGKAADGYNAGTYLLKATIDSDHNITFTWIDEADYKNPQNI